MDYTIIEDEDRYDGLQTAFLDAIARTVKYTVEKHVTDPILAREIVAEVTFSVCCDLDGSSQIEHEGKVLEASLCFIEDNELVTGPSWMHEYASGIVSELYDTEAD